jgi:threonine dehydrogenase-like Zn-dependent dehydrogenase
MGKIVEIFAALPVGTLEQLDEAQETKNLVVGIGCIALMAIAALYWAHRK